MIILISAVIHQRILPSISEDHRYSGHLKTIFIADRGYENDNIFAHAQEHGVFYLIRAKDLLSNGIVSSVRAQLPKNQGTVNQSVSVTLTRKQTSDFRYPRPPMKALLPIFRQRNSRWKISKRYIICVGGSKHLSEN